MSRKKYSADSVHKRIAQLHSDLAALDYVCSGTLVQRRLPCGKKRCRCKATKAKLHGPYYYWGRRHGGKLVQKVLSPPQANLIARAIGNHKTVQRILHRWEQETRGCQVFS